MTNPQVRDEDDHLHPDPNMPSDWNAASFTLRKAAVAAVLPVHYIGPLPSGRALEIEIENLARWNGITRHEVRDAFVAELRRLQK